MSKTITSVYLDSELIDWIKKKMVNQDRSFSYVLSRILDAEKLREESKKGDGK